MNSISVFLESSPMSDIDVGKQSSKTILRLGLEAEFSTVKVASLTPPSPNALSVLCTFLNPVNPFNPSLSYISFD